MKCNLAKSFKEDNKRFLKRLNEMKVEREEGMIRCLFTWGGKVENRLRD